MQYSSSNFFSDISMPITGEIFTEILRCGNVVIERIVSSDQPDLTTYNQEQDEWVILLQGHAMLEINDEVIKLNSGDYLFIPAHTAHRLINTSIAPYCIWLALHIYPEGNALN